jgi:hypothetical protein
LKPAGAAPFANRRRLVTRQLCKLRDGETVALNSGQRVEAFGQPIDLFDKTFENIITLGG